MDPFRRQLRSALIAKQGEVLTPANCAWIEVSAGTCLEPRPKVQGSCLIDASQAPQHLDFVNERTGSHLSSAEAITIARVDAIGRAVCVVAFHGFERWSVEATIATDGSKQWATPGYMRAIFTYPFETLDVSRIGVAIREDNTLSMAMCHRMGFKTEGFQPGRFGHLGAMLMGMRKTECRWIGGKHD